MDGRVVLAPVAIAIRPRVCGIDPFPGNGCGFEFRATGPGHGERAFLAIIFAIISQSSWTLLGGLA
jgi:hypothetical protein